MDSNIIIHVVSDTQDAGILLMTQIALVLGSIGTGLGIFHFRKRAPKKRS